MSFKFKAFFGGRITVLFPLAILSNPKVEKGVITSFELSKILYPISLLREKLLKFKSFNFVTFFNRLFVFCLLINIIYIYFFYNNHK